MGLALLLILAAIFIAMACKRTTLESAALGLRALFNDICQSARVLAWFLESPPSAGTPDVTECLLTLHSKDARLLATLDITRAVQLHMATAATPRLMPMPLKLWQPGLLVFSHMSYIHDDAPCLLVLNVSGAFIELDMHTRAAGQPTLVRLQLNNAPASNLAYSKMHRLCNTGRIAHMRDCEVLAALDAETVSAFFSDKTALHIKPRASPE